MKSIRRLLPAGALLLVGGAGVMMAGGDPRRTAYAMGY
jgi:hypothetical protein